MAERWLALALLTALSSCTPRPAGAPPRPSADNACAAFLRELSFAKSVHDRDRVAFAEHVLPTATFVSGDTDLLRGRDAIVKGWDGILKAEGLDFGWYPTTVVRVAPGVALSRGPFWMATTNAEGPRRIRKGVFQSTWVLDHDGVWRVAIDGGTPPPEPVSQAWLDQIKAAAPSSCPASLAAD